MQDVRNLKDGDVIVSFSSDLVRFGNINMNASKLTELIPSEKGQSLFKKEIEEIPMVKAEPLTEHAKALSKVEIAGMKRISKNGIIIFKI
jgi:hypothetical protein